MVAGVVPWEVSCFHEGLLDWRVPQPIVADFRIVVPDAAFLARIVGARCHIEEMRWLAADPPAAVGYAGGDPLYRPRPVCAPNKIPSDAIAPLGLAPFILRGP